MIGFTNLTPKIFTKTLDMTGNPFEKMASSNGHVVSGRSLL